MILGQKITNFCEVEVMKIKKVEVMKIKIDNKHLLLVLFLFVFIFAICGATAAATSDTSTKYIKHVNNQDKHVVLDNDEYMSNISELSNDKVRLNDKIEIQSKKIKNDTGSSYSGSDPIISGTVTINEFGHIRPLPNATITVVNDGRTLAMTTTDANGNYTVTFFSAATQFSVTASYMGCTSITNTVNVTKAPDPDPNYYGTSNFQLTPLTADVDKTVSGKNVYLQGQSKSVFAGTIQVLVQNSPYLSYCIDLFTPITTSDFLRVNGPLPGTAGDLPSGVDWGKVNYIIKNYQPTSASEAAAIQCAIWYFTSAVYGPYDQYHPSEKYQFLTAPYDGRVGTSDYSVRTRAYQIINAAQSMLYPTSVTVTPETIRIPYDGSATVTATVLDNNGNPLPDIQVEFTSTGGTLTIPSPKTDANGQIIAILSGVPSNTSVTVTASVSGNYGNLLYDNQYATTRKQNLVALNLLPSIVSDISIVNSDPTANVTLSKSANTPVNVNDTVTFTITATNNGPSTATGLMISDVAPAELSNVVYTPSAGTTYYNGIWTIPSLNNGSSATLTITGIATSTMAGKTITNTATRIAQNEYNSEPSTATASVYTKKAEVEVDMVLLNFTHPGQPVQLNDAIEYWTTVSNNGPDTATGIQVYQNYPTWLKCLYYWVSWDNGTTWNETDPSYDPLTGYWTIPSLPAGTENNAMLVVYAIINQTGVVSNDVIKTSQNEYDPTEPDFTIIQFEVNSGEQPEIIHPDHSGVDPSKVADVDLDMTYMNFTHPGQPVQLNDAIEYWTTVSNNGPDTATGIQVYQNYPTWLKCLYYWVSWDNGTTWNETDPSYDPNTGIWTIPSLATGASNNAILVTYAIINQTGIVSNDAIKIKQNESDPTEPDYDIVRFTVA